MSFNTADYFTTRCLIPNMTKQESTKAYDELGPKYDEYVSAIKYCAPVKLAQIVSALFPDKANVKVLDLACGTGLVGEALREAGFTCIDGVDPSQVSLDIAKEKGMYRKLVCSYIGVEGEPLPLEDGSYDLVAMSGSMGVNMVPCSGIHELVRLTKPGGYTINIFREEILTTVPEYIDRLDPLMDSLEKEGKWKRVSREALPDYQVDRPGIINLHQRL